MSVNSKFDFSHDRVIYYKLSSTRYNHTLKVDSGNKEVTMEFDKNQFGELLQEIIDNDYFEVNDEGVIITTI